MAQGGRQGFVRGVDEIMMDEKERDIWVGESRLYLDNDDVVHATIVGEVDEEMAIRLNETYYKFMNMVEGTLNCLVDLNRAGKQSSVVRNKGKEILEDERIGKIAFLGMHPVARVIASFVMGVTNKKDMRFFKIKEEAIAWLKE